MAGKPLSPAVWRHLLSCAPHYGRLVLAGRWRRRPDAVPQELSREAELRVEPGRLAAYRAVCGFGPGDVLPLTYPQVLAFPLQLAIMADRAFPVRALGLVHLRQQIEQQRALRPGERFEFRCRLAAQRQTTRGLELDLELRVSVAAEPVWRSQATYLARSRERPPRSPAPAGPLDAELALERRFHVAPSTARRYALISGDLNLIHLHALLARPFGFHSSIAHGLWSLARCLAALPVPCAPLRACCEFKAPLALPAEVVLRARAEGDLLHFDLLSADGSRPHLVGELEPLGRIQARP